MPTLKEQILLDQPEAITAEVSIRKAEAKVLVSNDIEGQIQVITEHIPTIAQILEHEINHITFDMILIPRYET